MLAIAAYTGIIIAIPMMAPAIVLSARNNPATSLSMVDLCRAAAEPGVIPTALTPGISLRPDVDARRSLGHRQNGSLIDVATRLNVLALNGRPGEARACTSHSGVHTSDGVLREYVREIGVGDLQGVLCAKSPLYSS